MGKSPKEWGKTTVYRNHLNHKVDMKYVRKDKHQVMIGIQLHQKVWCQTNTAFTYYCMLTPLEPKKESPSKVSYRKNLLHQRNKFVVLSSSKKYLLSFCYVPGIVLTNLLVNKTPTAIACKIF